MTATALDKGCSPVVIAGLTRNLINLMSNP
jgi:hypothetical protein